VSENALLEVRDLVKHFPVRKGLLGRTVAHVKAVDGISFDVPRGKTLGLVGESGCGKTTAGRCVLRLIEPTSGQVRFGGTDVRALRGEELRSLRRNMQIIFQDPYSSLNPRMTVEGIVGEGLTLHKLAKRGERRERVAGVLERVGLSADAMDRYPHEFSGGQRQRIGIARAVAIEPGFIVCDEPVSALDVSVQAQIVNLLMDLQRDLRLTYLFIAHNLAVVEQVSREVAVMYLGRLVERASPEELYRHPLHPYTRALLSAVPEPDPETGRERIRLPGEVPSPINPPPGCPFHPRCSEAHAECRELRPRLTEVRAGHWCACLRVGGIAEKPGEPAPPSPAAATEEEPV